jgi:hypothetical protein
MEELSSYYHLAREFATSTNRNIFLTGKAGTGKTTFLRNLQKETKKQMAIVAPTGVAAINAGGTTIHSFFQLPLTPFVPTAEGRKDLVEKTRMQRFRRKVIQELELLVIDEISMVRADILDAVDTILRHVRYNYKQPFGGVQVIFIGDMFQLSPVAVEDEWRMLSAYYQSPYFFHSHVIAEQKPVYIELDKIFRQTNADFIRLLNEVRNNRLSDEGLKLLQSRYNPFFTPPNDDTYITLTTHNYKADKINSEELGKLNSKPKTFRAEVKGDFPDKIFPTDKELVLKTGAKVMFIKNDTESPRRFYNGKIGVVDKMQDDKITIKCPGDDSTIEIEPMDWENIRYSTNERTKQIQEDVIGKFTQFPLRLAWAITIHKSQGLTFDKAVIDAGDAFASGQVYVALSRCRSLEGMILRSKINPFSIENDKLIVEHERNKLPVELLEKELTASRNEFRLYVLNQIFDFRTGIGLISRLLRSTEEVAGSFSEETLPYLRDLVKQGQNIQEVSDKFSMQLQRIMSASPIDEDYLAERLNAATDFFKTKISILLDSLRQSPASTDSRDNARDYNDELRTIFGFVAQKAHLLKVLQHPFAVEDYFLQKNTFLLPDFSVNAYGKNATDKLETSKHPKLFFKLLALRNQICEPNDMPIYLVANSKTLIEMADYLPLNEKDLLKINGFGPAKVEKYGDQFLEIIQQYCIENNLNTNIDSKKTEKREKAVKEKKIYPENTEVKEKKQKGDSNRITFEMYTAGKSIEEIAAERNLATSTICGHLFTYIKSGQLDIDRFISPDKREKAMTILSATQELGAVSEILSGVLDKNEINFFLSWKRTQ